MNLVKILCLLHCGNTDSKKLLEELDIIMKEVIQVLIL